MTTFFFVDRRRLQRWCGKSFIAAGQNLVPFGFLYVLTPFDLSTTGLGQFLPWRAKCNFVFVGRATLVSPDKAAWMLQRAHMSQTAKPHRSHPRNNWGNYFYVGWKHIYNGKWVRAGLFNWKISFAWILSLERKHRTHMYVRRYKEITHRVYSRSWILY